MRNFAVTILLTFLLLQITTFSLRAQEENDAIIKQGTHYYDLKIKSLDKYNSRIKKQQDRLIKKLKRKEANFEHKLKSSDSLAYAKYKHQSTPSFDSISRVSKSDTGATAANFSKQRNASIDSLRGVANFVQSKSGLQTSVPGTQGQNAEMSQMQGKLNFRTYITQLITQRTNSLKNVAGSSDVPGLTGIEKQVFYGKAKMNVYKDMEEDPSKAEDKAMEYLQGSEGFDKSMGSATQTSGGTPGLQALSGVGTTPTQMQQMGYQTKQLTQTNLQKNFGSGLTGITKQMSGELTEWQNKEKDLTGTLSDSKKGMQQFGGPGQPSFKVNPMRKLPFWKRIQKQYSWQTTRASADGTQPATIQPAALFGYMQSPKLVYGLGAATSFGLGQSWTNLHFTFQGIGLRSFATWAWQYGIGIYTGYERMYDRFTFIQNSQSTVTDNSQSIHSTASYTESLLAGLTKTYNMNKKYNGQIQVLYDIWWQEKGLRSPIVLRFATTSK